MSSFDQNDFSVEMASECAKADRPEQRCLVVVNVADMIRATFDGIIALNQHNNAGRMPILPAPQQQLAQAGACSYGERALKDGYVGVYDHDRYGVYNDSDKLAESMKFLKGGTQQAFSNYEDALAFAVNGIADLRGVSVSDIPVMQYGINWLQMVK